MKEILIKMNIKSDNDNYSYNGIANLNRDIITFCDKDEYIFDKRINRLSKINKNKKIIIDFNNKLINISDKDNRINIDIDVTKKDISENKIEIIYKIDKNRFNFKLIIEGDFNE